MKKTLGIILAILMTLTLSVTAFAADDAVQVPLTDGQGSAAHDVNAEYKEDADVTNTVYHVTIAWDVQSNLTYTKDGATYTWNPTELEYTKAGGTTGKWDGSATVNVTVTNSSNAEITATPKWASKEGITATCTGANAVNVGRADEGVTPGESGKGQAKKETITGTITVSAGSISSDDTKIGTITVTIAPKQP